MPEADSLPLAAGLFNKVSAMKNQGWNCFQEDYDHRIHFYFCILVAVGLSRKQGRITSNRQKNAFIMRWLKKAQQSFRQTAESEIAWLRQEILRNTPDNDPEPMLQMIYQTATEIKSR